MRPRAPTSLIAFLHHAGPSKCRVASNNSQDADCNDAFNVDKNTCEYTDFAEFGTTTSQRRDAGDVAQCKFTASLDPAFEPEWHVTGEGYSNPRFPAVSADTGSF